MTEKGDSVTNQRDIRSSATSPRNTRARSLVESIDADFSASVRTLRDALKPVDDSPEDHALTAIECFGVVALNLMRKTNPSKVRDVARTFEIKARLDGKQVLEVQ